MIKITIQDDDPRDKGELTISYPDHSAAGIFLRWAGRVIRDQGTLVFFNECRDGIRGSEALTECIVPDRVSSVSGEQINDRRCPHCGAYKAMPNPIEHLQNKLPFSCIDCGRSFNASADTE